MSRLGLLISLAALASCSAPQEELVGKPPPTEQKSVEQTRQPVEKPAATQRQRFPPARLTIAGWPFQEPGYTFTLTWAGGNKRLPMHEKPDPNSPLIGDVVWDDGERILWNDTVIATYQPRVLRATEEWFVEGPVYREGFLIDQQYEQLEVKKGEQLQVWGYAGDNRCFMSQRSDIISGPCPPGDRFDGLAEGQVAGEWYMPVQKIWWIQITGNNISGWVPVDDRMAVDIVAQ